MYSDSCSSDVRNHIAEKHFFSKFILSVSNSHERLGEAVDNFHIKCQIWRHALSPCCSKQSVHLQNYILSYTNRWVTSTVHILTTVVNISNQFLSFLLGLHSFTIFCSQHHQLIIMILMIISVIVNQSSDMLFCVGDW